MEKMKRTLAALLCGALLLASPVVAQEDTPATVELLNGSFESTENGLPVGWMFYPAGEDSGFELSMESAGSFEGANCAKIRASSEVADGQFGNLTQSFDVTPWQGKTVQFRAAVKTADLAESGRAQLWFRVDGDPVDGRTNTIAFDNMSDRPITGDEWQYHEITARITEDARRLIVGVLVFPTSTIWIDDVSLRTIESDAPTTADRFQSTGGSQPAAATPTPDPFYNHWLLLLAVGVVLMVISQWGRFGGTLDLQGKLTSFGIIRRFAFRFALVYWLLYSFPSPFREVMFSWGMKLYVWYNKVSEAVVTWTGTHILKLENLTNTPGGSGDTTYDYVRVFTCFCIAMLVALAWSLVDRRQTDHRNLNDLLRSYIRYVLAFTMLGYGMAKVFTLYNQFPEPAMSQLQKTWGDSSPMNVLWTFMGASRPYTTFAGLGEVAGGLLLIWRRTTIIGAIVTFGVMLNVVLLNFCYDVPVKQYSFHLAFMAIFLILPDSRRLGNILFWNRPTVSVDQRPPFTGSRTIWLHRIVKGWLIVVGVGIPMYERIKTEINYNPAALGTPEWFGWYEVEEFLRDGEPVPPLRTDGTRWDSVFMQRYPWNPDGTPGSSDSFLVRMMNGGYGGGACEVDDQGDSIKCVNIASEAMQLDIKGDSLVSIRVKTGQSTLEVRLKRVRREDFLLVNRGFHWINEMPYNR